MFSAFLYKDFVLLRHRARSFLMLGLTIAGTTGLLAVATKGTGAFLFGVDFLRLLLLSLVGLAAFLEHYADSLASDKRDGVLAIVLLSGRSPLAYFVVKVVLPLVIALAATFVSVSAYLLLVSPNGFSGATLGYFLAVIISELILAMGLGMVLNIVTSVDIRTNPSIVLPLVLVNAPLLYFLNPATHLALFCLVTVGLGFVAYATSLIFIAGRYRSNLS